MTTNEEKALIEAAQKNPEQFAALYEKYVDKIYAFVYNRVGHNRDVADDVTAEVFARALKTLPKFTWQGHPYSSYLYRVARSVCQEFYKEQTIVDIDDIVVKNTENATTVARAELNITWEAIQEFPPDIQELFELRYLEDLPYDEIAEIVGKTSGAVRTAISRATKKLKEQIDYSAV